MWALSICQHVSIPTKVWTRKIGSSPVLNTAGLSAKDNLWCELGKGKKYHCSNSRCWFQGWNHSRKVPCLPQREIPEITAAAALAKRKSLKVITFWQEFGVTSRSRSWIGNELWTLVGGQGGLSHTCSSRRQMQIFHGEIVVASSRLLRHFGSKQASWLLRLSERSELPSFSTECTVFKSYQKSLIFAS